MPNKPVTKRKPWHVKPKQMHERTVDNSTIYNSWSWRKYRKKRLAEEPLCRKCDEKGLVVVAKVLDHIVRIEDGGEVYLDSNTQPLCVKCHNSKSGREAHGYKEN
ncbi:HNHc domain-containing protein [Tenacibaculum sp. 190524A02b]|uniref:HNH endonuclease signature motif containing protein n=1 Tax=Tenacibaculum vairaonense TaxID=3137860 RepID=UPI0032B29B67